MPPRTKGKSKKELLSEEIAAAVGAGREVAVETVDFSDPNRPKTCLEVDFPIIPINQTATLEASSGALVKPIYQMSKWWARRPSSVFRSMLLAAAIKAPEDESKAAKAVWDAYYANHQKRGSLHHLKVAEPFMGGGTTIVEGSRLGMQMFGCDLNPVAWFVVKNEMAQVDIAEVKRLIADIEAEVKPMIMPYYACDGPDGEKGKWFRRAGKRERKRELEQVDFTKDFQPPTSLTEDDWEELPTSFDVFSVPWQERKNYRYEGPEIIYTFWAKHGPCQRAGCGHRTPIMSSPVIAIKTLTVDAWVWECSGCKKSFDVERHAARMSPDSPLFVAPDEKPFAVMDEHGRYECPHCGKTRTDAKALVENESPELGKAKSKQVDLTVLIHPQWLEGCPKADEQGREYGGSVTDSIEATIRWNNTRAAKLRLLEVRGKLPGEVTCPETKVKFFTDDRGGTVPKKSTFTCAEDGTPNDVLEAVKSSSKTGPMAAYTFQGYSPAKNLKGEPFGGRFFSPATKTNRFNQAQMEWDARKTNDLQSYWPQCELSYGWKTHGWAIPEHGFTHYWKMFNPLQLLVHSQLLKSLLNANASEEAKRFVLGAFQQYLRFNCSFTIWHRNNNQMSAFLSNNNYHVKANTIETSVFNGVGDGSWQSALGNILEALSWKTDPWDIVSNEYLRSHVQTDIHDTLKGKCQKLRGCGNVTNNANLSCGSSTDWAAVPSESVDLVLTFWR
jgi:hypothetical protein